MAASSGAGDASSGAATSERWARAASRLAQAGGSPDVPADQLHLELDERSRGGTDGGRGQFNPRFTFDTFVVGPTNRLAHGTARCVAENTAEGYSPLFVHGDPGNGKTHLLHAIGLHVTEHSPELDVRYVTAERFTGEFVEGVRRDRLEGFKRRYRRCSVLLVDDVQFLEGKEQTQNEFFHTFNDVTAASGRVVLTADRHPSEIATLPDALRSRFRSGLVADLQAPERDTRLEILRRKAAASGAVVPEEVLELLAERVTRSVRELEGALIRVVADASLEQRPVSLEPARRSLDEFLGSAARPLTLRRIVDEAADVFGVTVDELCARSRTRPLVAARQATMYVCRLLTDESLPTIGRSLGRRDHTTVLHAVRKVEKQMAERTAVYHKVVELMNRLGRDAPRP